MNTRRREWVFVVRMWLESESTPPAWRGSIHDVESDLKRYVTGPEEAAEFITIRLSDRKA